MPVTHTIRSGDGGTKTFDNLTRGLAIKLHCTECMGWESDPKDCVSTKCALYPFRGRVFRGHRGDETPEGDEIATKEPPAPPSEGGGA